MSVGKENEQMYGMQHTAQILTGACAGMTCVDLSIRRSIEG